MSAEEPTNAEIMGVLSQMLVRVNETHDLVRAHGDALEHQASDLREIKDKVDLLTGRVNVFGDAVAMLALRYDRDHPHPEPGWPTL